MNPLGWRREHQVAWAATCLLGAIVGQFVGFLHWQWAYTPQAGQLFATWLTYPETYWPWPTFGVLIAGLGFYIARLIKA